jgi:undecaprenyl-diphosphatase
VASVVSLVLGALIRPFMEPFRGAPIAVGVGLVTTGLALASVVFAPKARVEGPSLLGAAALGAVHGLAGFPGASPLGAALTMLLWLGVKPGRALDLSLLISIPGLAAAFIRTLVIEGSASAVSVDELPIGTIAMGCVIAFLCAVLAGSALRGLMARRRLGALALWVIPLGLATIAYARALGDLAA